jgi:PEP-CTERM motif
MRNRAFSPIAAILSILLLTGTPAHAGPVAINDVIQVLRSYQNPPDLRLRGVSQDSATFSSASIKSPDNFTRVLTNETPDTLLAGVALSSGEQQAGVDIIDQGDVEGTVCDCGEIAVPGGGFPKWPLLFLAAIPFFFIHGCDSCDQSTPPSTAPQTPELTATPTVPSVPEPASLLLFSTALVAFGGILRRRHARGKLALQLQVTEEG